ncbi:MAG TPA: 4Fe-4S binding protein [bacterium]|nr:4Fe-4S binding protein [bacterium]
MIQLIELLSRYQLWIIFLIAGIILYLLKLHPIRKVMLFLSVIVLGFYLGGCPCPSGSVFHLFTGVGSFLFIISTITTLLFGRVYCGWVCPLGAVQELIFTGRYRIRIPENFDRYSKYVKFLILATFLYLTISTSTYTWGKYEPFKVLFNFGGNRIAFILLLITMGLSMFIERVFCRYICPMGAVFSIISRFSIFGLRINKDRCVNCLRCTRDICPMGAIETTHDKIKIDKRECIDCLKCKDICSKGAPTCK